jgi:hypothetical protein
MDPATSIIQEVLTNVMETRVLTGPISLTDFDVGITLGTGSFGRVKFATHKVKIINCSPKCHIIILKGYWHNMGC